MGMRVLVYGNRKQDDVIYDVSTPEKEEAAFRTLFKLFDEEWQVYSELKDVDPPIVCEACTKSYCKGCEDQEDCACQIKGCPSNENHNNFEKSVRLRWIGYYQKAKTGDAKYMKMLMSDRSSRQYEYETFHFARVKDATA